MGKGSKARGKGKQKPQKKRKEKEERGGKTIIGPFRWVGSPTDNTSAQRLALM